MKKTVVAFFLICSGICVLYPSLALGALLNSCVYTEENIEVPQELASGEIITTKNVYQAKGTDRDDSCLPIMGKINRELVGIEMETGNPAGWTKYYTSRGQTIEDIPQGKVFHVVKVLRITKHGLQTIDSGPGPIDYLVLADEKGELFQIATVLTGSNKRT